MPPLIARRREPTPILSGGGEPPSLRRRSYAASAALHIGIVLALLLLIRPTPLPEEPVVTVRVVNDGPGAAGVAGGGGGDAREARNTPASEHQDEAPPTARAAPVEPEAQAAASPTPPQPEPPTPASPTAQAVALDAPPTPPRQKPRPAKHHEASPPSTSEVTSATAPTSGEDPLQIAAAPAIAPTPGTPGAGSGPGGTGGIGTGAYGAGHGAIGDGPRDGPGDDYLDRLKRWLNKFKRYPKDAIDKKQEGRLVVSFVVLRDGTVLDPRIERSSGIPSLDEAAIAMLRAASPVPPLPETYRGERAALDLPVGYSIGLFDKLF